MTLRFEPPGNLTSTVTPAMGWPSGSRMRPLSLHVPCAAKGIANPAQRTAARRTRALKSRRGAPSRPTAGLELPGLCRARGTRHRSCRISFHAREERRAELSTSVGMTIDPLGLSGTFCGHYSYLLSRLWQEEKLVISAESDEKFESGLVSDGSPRRLELIPLRVSAIGEHDVAEDFPVAF